MRVAIFSDKRVYHWKTALKLIDICHLYTIQLARYFFTYAK